MKTSPTDKDKKRLFALLDELEWLFSVTNLQRSFSFVDRDLDDAPANADINVDPSYQRLHINIYPRFWKLDLEAQRLCILHEFCHTLTHPIFRIAMDLFEGRFHTQDSIHDATEEATSRVANMLDTQLNGHAKYSRDAYKTYVQMDKRGHKPKKRKKRKVKKL